MHQLSEDPGFDGPRLWGVSTSVAGRERLQRADTGTYPAEPTLRSEPHPDETRDGSSPVVGGGALYGLTMVDRSGGFR